MLTLNVNEYEYRNKLYSLNNSIRSLICNALSTFHDMTLVEYMLLIRNFLNQIGNNEPKNNVMNDTKNVINEYREMQDIWPLPENHMGYFYLYLILKYHDINRTMLSDYTNHTKNLPNLKQITYMGNANSIRPDYFEEFYKFVSENINDPNYMMKCNLLIKMYKNTYVKSRKLINAKIIYFNNYPGKNYRYNNGYYNYGYLSSLVTIDNFYMRFTDIYNIFTVKLLRDIKRYPQFKLILKLINNGFIIADSTSIVRFGNPLLSLSNHNLSDNDIKDLMRICEFHIGGIKALEILESDNFNIDSFIDAYGTLKNTYKYDMGKIFKFLEPNEYILPHELNKEIHKFENGHKFYYPNYYG